ncbi:hypothetical protein B0J14DRAFT_701240 [Halenospora varia]|nr:hypothetical protein B0J14DRAFT_701240 [Halenospora varia]
MFEPIQLYAYRPYGAYSWTWEQARAIDAIAAGVVAPLIIGCNLCPEINKTPPGAWSITSFKFHQGVPAFDNLHIHLRPSITILSRILLISSVLPCVGAIIREPWNYMGVRDPIGRFWKIKTFHTLTLTHNNASNDKNLSEIIGIYRTGADIAALTTPLVESIEVDLLKRSIRCEPTSVFRIQTQHSFADLSIIVEGYNGYGNGNGTPALLPDRLHSSTPSLHSLFKNGLGPPLTSNSQDQNQEINFGQFAERYLRLEVFFSDFILDYGNIVSPDLVEPGRFAGVTDEVFIGFVMCRSFC